MAQLNANLAGYEVQENFDVLAPGWYEARIIDSEIKDGPKGRYISWTFGIVGKPNRVWDVMSLGNDISLQRLKTLAICVGMPNPNYIADTEELHGKTCMVKLRIEKSEEYGNKNKISGFKPADNRQQTRQQTQTTHQEQSAIFSPPPPHPTENPKMPWEKPAV